MTFVTIATECLQADFRGVTGTNLDHHLWLVLADHRVKDECVDQRQATILLWDKFPNVLWKNFSEVAQLFFQVPIQARTFVDLVKHSWL